MFLFNILYGSSLAVVDRFYPSIKTCSNCGALVMCRCLYHREFIDAITEQRGV